MNVPTFSQLAKAVSAKSHFEMLIGLMVCNFIWLHCAAIAYCSVRRQFPQPLPRFMCKTRPGGIFGFSFLVCLTPVF